ncbi:hypothetical protein HYDPIDRAFT_116541 [Hydnomerulius pinastri MD-312]|uniref:Uncharacterized protein n=1 Tax=Hydnomerulius pinastri MD-312 TaxID=994086 RepID=A0A0C9VSY5_9AGAM|nr:hypothetical protein HYDPIDRAFT_116541 [Hydnomerulius pinastri MD-312]
MTAALIHALTTVIRAGSEENLRLLGFGSLFDAVTRLLAVSNTADPSRRGISLLVRSDKVLEIPYGLCWVTG